MKTALIGVGTITQDYYLGLTKSKLIDLVALVDVDSNPIGRKCFPSLPLYFTIGELLKNHQIECVIISTPPKQHYALIKEMLSKKINVIVEKPTVLDILEFKKLMKLAKENKCLFNTCFHWQNGAEVRMFNRKYDKKKIKSIYIHVDDPYSIDGININEDKIKLEGAFVDSGVNALSMVKMWLPFKEYKIDSCNIVFAKNIHLPIYADVSLLIDNIPIRIEIDWRNNINKKISRIKYEDREIIIDHSMQKIIDGSNEYVKDNMPRLSRHYYNYFVSYKGKTNLNEAYKIHEVLLGVKKYMK